MKEVQFEAVDVMYVQSANGPQGAQAAFNALESRLPSMKGRKLYGTFMPAEGDYRACAAVMEGDDPEALGLITWTIPGGTYARSKLADWTQHVEEIGRIFATMSDEAGDRYDASRPSIEFYRSHDEAILLLPLY
jgi:hypothetical protein